MLSLRNIEVTFSKKSPLQRTVLNDLSLEVQQGEWVIIMGGNGAGKSTLLNVISGAITPDKGTRLIDGQPLMPKNKAHLVSQVVQNPYVGTISGMTILENMAFAYRRGMSRGLRLFSNAQRQDLFRQRLRLLGHGLDRRLDDLVDHLSGGQRQALSVVMATLQTSKVLLLDEITSALDPINAQMVMDFTKTIVRAERLTCLMITHNINEALTYGDRLLVVKDGAVYKNYDIKAKSALTSYDLMMQLSGQEHLG